MRPKTILVPIDYSTCSLRALDYACALASSCDATIHLVHAVGPLLADVPLSMATKDELLQDQLETLGRLAAARHAQASFGDPIVRLADPRDLILGAAESLRADLIIMGTHGRRGVSRLVLGSVAEDIVRRAECPVLTIRAPLQHEAAAA